MAVAGELDPSTGTSFVADLVSGSALLGVPLTQEQAVRCKAFADLLVECNARLNLTRIAGRDVVPLHFLDSLAALAVHNPVPNARLIDIGTGAGFPGVVLGIARPDLRLTLLDATRKKLDFVRVAVAAAGMAGAHVVHGRAEDLAHDPAHRERFDVATARAVAPMRILAEWTLPYVRTGGVVLALKSADVAPELKDAEKAIRALGADLEGCERVAVPGTDIVRAIVVMRKTRSTDARFPRPAAVTKARPL